MGKFYFSADYFLGLLCAAALAFPSLASAGGVSVEVSPTTGYTSTTSSTFAPPARSSTTAIQTYKPTLGPLSGGGAYQTMQSGITITAIKQDGQTLSSTISSRLRATAGAMRSGAVRCFTSFRCNLALSAGAAGIQSLLDGIDYIMGDGGRIYKTTLPPVGSYECPAGSSCTLGSYANGQCQAGLPCPTDSGHMDRCNASPNGPCFLYHFNAGGRSRFVVIGSYYNVAVGVYGPLVGLTTNADGYVRGVYSNNTNISPIKPQLVPVPNSEIPSVFENYVPDPSDLPFLASGGLDFAGDGVDIEIIDIPSVTGADSPNYVEYSDGTSKGTYSEYEFSWGAPSKQPEISVNEKTTETTYDETGAVSDVTVSGGTSSGSSANNPPEIPTDCDFMPTVCRFIDWFTEPDPEMGQDPDFGQLIDTIDIERDFSVGSSTASCPAPFVIQLSWVPSVEVSLQPFCDFVDLLRPVLLALAYLVSGAIILRT